MVVSEVDGKGNFCASAIKGRGNSSDLSVMVFSHPKEKLSFMPVSSKPFETSVADDASVRHESRRKRRARQREARRTPSESVGDPDDRTMLPELELFVQ